MDGLWLVSDDRDALNMATPFVDALGHYGLSVSVTPRRPRWPIRRPVWVLGSQIDGPRHLTLLLAPTMEELERVKRYDPKAPIWVVDSLTLSDSESAPLTLPRIVPDPFYPPGSGADLFGLTAAYRLESRPRLVYIGRYRDGAALTRALNVARQLLAWDGELILVEGHEVRPRMAPVVAHLGLAERVVFLPTLPISQWAALYLSADVIIVAEADDAPATAVSWAMASGTPVVAQHSPHNLALLGDAALWIYGTDDEVWRRGVDRALNDEVLREELSRRALARAEGWHQSLSVSQWLKSLAPDALT
ncbi:MAG: glycosyltransferase [Firmicutes bacterium]|nr:glycosyltransferase [Bacillota bacterium]